MRFAPVTMTSGTGYDTSNAFRFSIQAVASGTPTGTLTIQVSNDGVLSQDKVANWANAQAPISISANGVTFYSFPDTPAKWVRITYSGTGAVACSLFTQGV